MPTSEYHDEDIMVYQQTGTGDETPKKMFLSRKKNTEIGKDANWTNKCGPSCSNETN